MGSAFPFCSAARAGYDLRMQSYAGPQRFFVEFDAAEACPFTFTDDPVVILFFASWAYSVEFGGTHELAAAAMHLRRAYKLDLKPIVKYADRNIEGEADKREFERSWQPAVDLATCARAVASAWDHPDERLAPLIEGYEHLAPRLLELAAMCDWAAARDARVRMSFDLETQERHAERPR